MNVDYILKESGYKTDRKVDLTNIINLYNEYNYTYTNNQLDFLERYGMLEIHYPHP